MSRFILEGEWSGYTSAQSRIVHREVVKPSRVARLRQMYGIRYTDGTMLYLSLRDARPREKVTEIMGYADMICEAEGMTGSLINVSDMRNDE